MIGLEVIDECLKLRAVEIAAHDAHTLAVAQIELAASLIGMICFGVWVSPCARNWPALDRDCATNTCHGIERDNRRWNACASLAPV
jgi:hypothetical protein